MKVFLLYKNRDFNPEQNLLSNEEEIIQDLELNILFNAMANDDEFIFEMAKKTILSFTTDLDTILYRQDILKDCLENPEVIREIYHISIESIEMKRKTWFGIFSKSPPSSILHSSVELLKLFLELLKKLKDLANTHAEKFKSKGFKLFFTNIKKELNDEYFNSVQNLLSELEFRNGVLISAELGKGNEGENYTLCKQQVEDRHWMKRIFKKKVPSYTFYIGARDETGARILWELKDRALNLSANACSQSVDHINSFFNRLRIELAFYIGCLNLHEHLVRIGMPVCFPVPVPSDKCIHSFQELYDVCLALTIKQKITGNNLNAINKNLWIITGANQGGKSTFLRSIGLAQLMMQCGMFVPAKSFRANIYKHIFTHYKRKEDSEMKSGKLDEEFKRMNNIVDKLTSNSMLLLNESFAATNEREGSEIARQIISALLEKNVNIFFVTHLYEFAHYFHKQKTENVIFLCAERLKDGKRTFKIIEGEPLETSFGEDLYKKVFEDNV